MWIVAIAALIVAAPFVGSWWMRRETIRLRMADEVWGDLEYHAGVLLEDRTLDPLLGDLIEVMAQRVGTGRLTRKFLASLVRQRNLPEDEYDRSIDNLADGQHQHFLRFAILALYYDSLRAGVAGIILRRFVMYWLYATAVDRKTVVNDAQVDPILKVAERDYCPA